MRQSNKQIGFTIVELLIVIVVIGILATITIVAYSGIQQRANVATASSDLNNAATVLGKQYVDLGLYPTTLPSEVKASPKSVLQLANTGSNATMCINAYNTQDSSIRMSWDSVRGGLQSGLCSGATIGSPTGGTVPTAPRGINLMADFSRWSLSGGAVYNNTTKELTLGPAGVAQSPIIRIDSPVTIKIGGDFYATNASPYVNFAPQAGYLTGIAYFGSDGVTPATNSASYTANGCAQKFSINAWSINDQQCLYAGGPNVIYSSFSFSGSNAGYASSDLKIKNPLMLVSD